jgi:hypothetical protein
VTEQERKDKFGFFSGYARYEDAGYKKYLWFWFKPIWWFDNNTPDPLTLHHPDGYKLRPNTRFKTDFGSVPFLAQTLCPGLFSSFRWRKTYPLHDSGYMEEGLWYAEEGEYEYTFRPMTRAEVDEVLDIGIKAEGGSAVDSAPIWFGVRIGGWMHWGKEDLKKTKEA